MDGKSENQFILYQTEDGETRVQVMMQDETVWLSQKQMVELFQRDQSVISRHVNNVFKEGELDPESNIQFLHIANLDKPVAFYNLDVIISVGSLIRYPLVLLVGHRLSGALFYYGSYAFCTNIGLILSDCHMTDDGVPTAVFYV